MVVPPAGTHVAVFDASFSVSVQDFIIAGINPDVTDAFNGAGGVFHCRSGREENKISRFQFAAFDLCPVFGLIACAAGKFDAVLLIYILNERRAVEGACVACFGSQFVRSAEIFLAECKNFVGFRFKSGRRNGGVRLLRKSSKSSREGDCGAQTCDDEFLS